MTFTRVRLKICYVVAYLLVLNFDFNDAFIMPKSNFKFKTQAVITPRSFPADSIVKTRESLVLLPFLSQTNVNENSKEDSDLRKQFQGITSFDAPECLNDLREVILLHDIEEEAVDIVSARELVHPLAIPLTRNKKTGAYTCILVFPSHIKGQPWSVVRTSSSSNPGRGLELLSMDANQYLMKLVIEIEDVVYNNNFQGRANINIDDDIVDVVRLIDIANKYVDDNAKKYTTRDLKKSGYNVDQFLFMKVGPFPDVFETLTYRHLTKGDEQAALVTAEKAYNTFKGWGQPYATYCKILKEMPSRELELRDAALAAFRTPLWTIATSEAELKEIGSYTGKGDYDFICNRYWTLYADETRGEDQIKQGKPKELVATERAAFLMDAATLGANDIKEWKDVREKLSAMYEEADILHLAKLVKA